MFYRFFRLRKLLLWRPVLGLTIELTDRCNLKCGYCPRGSVRSGGDIDYELFKRIVGEAAMLHIEQLVLVGFGESLLYPRLLEALRHVREEYPHIRLYLTTNGILLDEEMSGALIGGELIDQMTVSVNFGTRSKYLEFNRADAYDQVVSNTKAFLQRLNRDGSRRRPKARIQVMDTLNDPLEIETFRRFWQPLLAPNALLQIQPFINWGGLIRAAPTQGERYPCTHLQNSWIVSREGNALACCMVFPHESVRSPLILGNVRESSLKQLYCGPEIAMLRRKNMNCDYAHMPECQLCNAYITVPNIYVKNPLHFLIGARWL